MKKFQVWIIAMLAAVMLLAAGCGTSAARAVVTFDPLFGEESTQSVDVGGTVNEPAAPQADGYGFIGWFTDSACTETSKVTFPLRVEGDLTLYAGWRQGVYTMSFDANGGSDVASVSAAEDDYVAKPEDPKRAGFRFSGWFWDKECTRSFDFVVTGKMPNHDVTLYAGWTEVVTFTFVDGEEELFTIVDVPGTAVEAPEAPEKTGYVFDGWFRDKECETPFTFSKLSDDSTVYAKYHLRNSAVNVTFRCGTATETKTGREGDALNVTAPGYPVAAESKYYVFLGWSLDEAGVDRYEEEVFPAEDVTLYAQFARDAGWAKVKVLESSYNTGAEFYIENGSQFTLADKSVALDIPSDLVYDGFLTTTGMSFDPEAGDYVSGDMELNINLFSKGLLFRKVYMNRYTGAYVYADDEGNLPTDQAAACDPVASFVRGFDGVSGAELFIPTYYDGLKVLKIEANVFRDQNSVVTAHLPEFLQVVGDNAFENCTSLTAIDLPETLTELDDSVFNGCAALARVSAGSKLYYFGYKVFEGTKYIDDLCAKTPNGAIYLVGGRVLYTYNGTASAKLLLTKKTLLAVAGGAFEGQTKLEYVELGSKVAMLGTAAFKDCSELSEVVFPTDIRYLMPSVFENCAKLETASLKDCGSLLEIGAKAFAGTALTTFYLPKTVTTIGSYAFQNCDKLASFNQVTSGATLTAIPEGCFDGCTALANFITMNATQSIGAHAFRNCTSLRSVTIGFSNTNEKDPILLDTIGAGAFEGCTGLRRFQINKIPADASAKTIELAADALPLGDEYRYKIFVENQYVNYYTTQLSAVDARYGELISYKDSTKPEVILRHSEWTIEANADFDLLALVKDTIVESAADNITAAEDLEYRIASVSYLGEKVTANESGRYDLSTGGRYSVKFYVVDEFGNIASNEFMLEVKNNLE